ncbi:heme lyase CcmF/NrfE family subunit [Propionivibrio sp.]|uniref:heme lyase CcmF/NrfE family subunit n=1 Tax=Propionivibrio sp. TaxID=2212460 RepID=UPI0039E4B28B
MIPELGHLGLILALQLALLQSVLGFSGAARGSARLMAAARGAAAGQGLFVALGFAALAWSFYVNDFSVLNVAEHSSRHLPAAYRLTATWGSHEGSILLWALILAAWTVAVAASARRTGDALAARALAVLGLVSTGFLAFILFTSNPFMRLDPPPPEGLDLNPLLQDPGMIIHPPLLYMGYVGFSVAFAFAVAALLAGRLDAGWARRARPWTLVAWLFLTLGIMVGSWWAYYELGWGGWWFWDPTENASLMPWLVGTALVHSLAATAKRGIFQVWTVFLAIGAFALSLIGTFLVRSGVLSSVHAFAQDPARGFFLLLLLAVLVGAALWVLALRAPKAGGEAGFAPCSRETLLLAGNVLLLVATGTVLLGTLYPLALDALGQGKVSVGPPYFNSVFVPLMAPALLLLGIGPRVLWQRADPREVLAGAAWPAIGAAILGPALSLAYGELRWQAALGVGLAAWIVLSTLPRLVRRGGSLAQWGMGLAHCGVAVGLVGIGLVTAFESERAVTLSAGESAVVAGHEWLFKGVVEVPGPNYSAVRGTLAVSRDGAAVAELHPEKRVYHASKMPMTESAIRYGLAGDLYVVLGDPVSHATWTVRIFHKPFVGWIWAGAMTMALGAALAALGRRRARQGDGE